MLSIAVSGLWSVLNVDCRVSLSMTWSMLCPGEDPLVDMVDGNDINSVAGVLKLYFRELGVPIFPVQMFDQLISCSRKSRQL